MSTEVLTDVLDLQPTFRETMASVVTPVTVITALSEGHPHGTTVSAFTSLSMDPPMVLISLDHGSELLAVIRRVGRFGVNVLGSSQSTLALAFARKGGVGKFAGVRWELQAGVPRIPDAGGFLACEVAQMVECGDHIVVTGNVVEAEPLGEPPLTYHARRFGTHAFH